MNSNKSELLSPLWGTSRQEREERRRTSSSAASTWRRWERRRKDEFVSVHSSFTQRTNPLGRTSSSSMWRPAADVRLSLTRSPPAGLFLSVHVNRVRKFIFIRKTSWTPGQRARQTQRKHRVKRQKTQTQKSKISEVIIACSAQKHYVITHTHTHTHPDLRTAGTDRHTETSWRQLHHVSTLQRSAVS